MLTVKQVLDFITITYNAHKGSGKKISGINSDPIQSALDYLKSFQETDEISEPQIIELLHRFHNKIIKHHKAKYTSGYYLSNNTVYPCLDANASLTTFMGLLEKFCLDWKTEITEPSTEYVQILRNLFTRALTGYNLLNILKNMFCSAYH